MIDITNEDNMLLMARYPDKYFDLAIVDPPYGINAPKFKMGSAPKRKEKNGYPAISTNEKLKGRINSGGGYFKGKNLTTMDCSWDTEPPKPEYFKELFRVSKNQIIFGGNYFNLPPTRCIVCWDKMQPWDNFSQFELAWTSFDKPAKLFKLSNTGGFNDIEKTHPTQKPIKLYKYLLEKFAKPGDKILDTHLGSGTIAIACHDYNFSLTGCELNKPFFDSASERIKKHTAQLQMF